MSLTAEHVSAIQASWHEVCKDTRNNGVDLFITFFTAHPKYQDYFKDIGGISLNELRTNKKLRIHATRVMHALSSMIQSLDELDVVAGIMSKTVDTHYKLGVKTIVQYEDLFGVLPEYMARHAGTTFSELCQEGWGVAITVLLSVIKQRFAELEQETTPSLTDEHIDAIQESWDEVCKDLRTNGTDLFITLFKAHPKYQELFKDLRGIPVDELRTNRKLRVHGTRVMHALSSMIQSLDELDVVAAIMIKTVDTHYSLGLTNTSPYKDLFDILPDYMTRHAGEKFTNKVSLEGWGVALGVLLSVAEQRLEELDNQTASMS